FDEPPASPSVTTDSAAPSTAAPPSVLPAVTFSTASPSTATQSTAAFAATSSLAGPSGAPAYHPLVAGRETGPRGSSIAHSGRSTMSSRIRQVQMDAEEQLAQLAREKLRIDAELRRKDIELQEAQIQRRLAHEVEELHSTQGSVRDADSVRAAEALDEWVEKTRAVRDNDVQVTVQQSERREPDARYIRHDDAWADQVRAVQHKVPVQPSERREPDARYTRRDNAWEERPQSEWIAVQNSVRENVPVPAQYSERREPDARYTRRDDAWAERPQSDWIAVNVSDSVHVIESERRDAGAHYARRDNLLVHVTESERRDAGAHYVRRDDVPVLANSSERRVTVPVNLREHRDECYGSRPACAPPPTQADVGPRMGYTPHPMYPPNFPAAPLHTGGGKSQHRLSVAEGRR
ncbi:hypothetical protein JYU34_004023, partial [Plutella xylostella]